MPHRRWLPSSGCRSGPEFDRGAERDGSQRAAAWADRTLQRGAGALESERRCSGRQRRDFDWTHDLIGATLVAMSSESRPAGPRPIALCLERLDGSLVRCTATTGREAGLAIDPSGEILWRSERRGVCELWVSQDERLMALRQQEAPAVTLERKGRKFEMPSEKPVVLRDQDELVLGCERFRVHVHGYARKVEPPRPLRRMLVAGSLGAAMAISTTACLDDAPATAENTPTVAQERDADAEAQEAEAEARDAGTDTSLVEFDAADEDVIPLLVIDSSDDVEVKDFPPK